MSTVKSEADEIVNKSTETLSKVIFAEHGYHHAKALATHKKQAKQLSLQQRDFDVVIRDMKRTSKRIAKNADVVIEVAGSGGGFVGGGEYGVYQFFGGCFAIATRDADDRNR